MRERGGTGREAEHDGAPAVLNRRSNLHFARLVGVVCDAVDLDQIDSPRGVLVQQRVVPGLAGGVVLHPPTGRVPGAGVGLVGRILRVKPVPSMGRLRSTLSRGMPRTMWMPNFSPFAWTQLAELLEAGVPVQSGRKARPGRE